jgi:hypothetical protein
MSSHEELEHWIAGPEAELTIAWQEAAADQARAAGADCDLAEYRTGAGPVGTYSRWAGAR